MEQGLLAPEEALTEAGCPMGQELLAPEDALMVA